MCNNAESRIRADLIFPMDGKTTVYLRGFVSVLFSVYSKHYALYCFKAATPWGLPGNMCAIPLIHIELFSLRDEFCSGVKEFLFFFLNIFRRAAFWNCHTELFLDFLFGSLVCCFGYAIISTISVFLIILYVLQLWVMPSI